MNWNKLKSYLILCKGQLIMLLIGAVLTFWADSAVELVTKVAAWILIVTGVYNVFKAASRREDVYFWIRTAVFLALGLFLLTNPMAVSRLLGRIVGVLLVIQGVKDLRGAVSRPLSIVTLIGGIVLFVLPVTMTNALLTLLGVVLMVVGGIHLLNKIFHTRKLSSGKDTNIVDAAP